MTDADYVTAIRCAVESLNASMLAARAAGMRVYVNKKRYPGRRKPSR